jgi:hypothetical protein
VATLTNPWTPEEVTGGTTSAPLDGYSNELVPVHHQAFIRERTVVIGSGCCIRCTEGVQDHKAAVFPEAVNHTVAIRAPGFALTPEGLASVQLAHAWPLTLSPFDHKRNGYPHIGCDGVAVCRESG